MPVVQPYPVDGVPVGGLRTRMIRDSLRNIIVTSLSDIGWFDEDRRHLPIKVIDRPNKWDDPIELNSLVISLEDRDDEEAELGSNLTVDTWTAYVDFYAESEDLGLQVAGDVRDILRGKMSSISRTDPSFQVFDYRVDPPEQFAVVQIQNVVDDRARDFPFEWQTFWFVIRADLEDTYLDESG